MLNEEIDIFILAWNRVDFTKNTIRFLHERTKHPFRIIVIDNHSTDGTPETLREMERSGIISHSVRHSKNIGVHQGWNTALGLAGGKYFITTDNDIYVPDISPDWLDQLVMLMEKNQNYAAISLQPHVYIGDSDPTPDPSGVIKKGHCGAVMRIMRTEAVRQVGGWDKHYDANRNHEELTVCSRLRSAGYDVGVTSFMRCYHDFGDDNNWGYGEVHPYIHGHRIPGGSKFAEGGPGELWPSPEAMTNQKDQFDTRTWERVVK